MNDPSDSTLATAVSDTSAADEPPERLSLSVVHEAGDWSSFTAPDRAIEAAGTAMASHLRCERLRGSEVTVVLADDDFVRTLNRTYRGKDQPTNVLSFPFQVPPGAAPSRLLGDVVLAAETVVREAKERRIAAADHLQHLAVHGILHLLGFEHESDGEAEDMEQLETEILAALGVADPYSAASRM